MFKAYILVRNVESSAESLHFGEFTITAVGPRFEGLRDTLSSKDVNRDDWVLEKSYTLLPPGPPGSPVGGIPNDIEDTLFVLRLFKPGDISFVRQAIVPPSGNTFFQLPYRAMNDVNSYSSLLFKVDPEDGESFKSFSTEIRKGQSWTSDWFAAAKRFFLCGGAKQFNPQWDDVDRILDYATALESTLVWEMDNIRSRISHRGAVLIEPGDATMREPLIRFFKRIYDVRSRIVHGSRLGDENRSWLSDNSGEVEQRVRDVLRVAVHAIPPGEEERRRALSNLYEPSDQDRGSFVLEKFREIKSTEVRKDIAAKIANVAGD